MSDSYIDARLLAAVAGLTVAALTPAALAQPSGHAAVGFGPIDERYEHVERTADGGLLIVGSRADTAPAIFQPDIWVTKVDALLVTQWEFELATPQDDVGWHGQQLSDGSFVVAGVSRQSATNQMVLVRLGPAGNVLWAGRYLGSPETNDGVVVRELSNQRLAFVGSERLPVVGAPSALLHIIDAATGAPLSSSRYTIAPQGNLTISLAHFADAFVAPGNPNILVIAGRADFSATAPFFTNYSRPVAMAVQLNTLNTLWCNAYGPQVVTANDFVFGDATGLTPGPGGNSAFLNGRMSFFAGGSFFQGLFVSRIDNATGAEAWMRGIDGLQASHAAVLSENLAAAFVATRPVGDGQSEAVFGRVDFGGGAVLGLQSHAPEYPAIGSVNTALYTLAKFAFQPDPSTAYLLGGTLNRPVPGLFFINDGYSVRTNNLGEKPCFQSPLSLLDDDLSVTPRALAAQRVAREGAEVWQPARNALNTPRLVLPCPSTVLQCNEADIAQTDGAPGPDGCVNNGDFQLFFANFFSAACGGPVPCNEADIAQTDGTPGPDGSVDNGDFSLFFSAFFSAVCPDCPA